MTTHARASFNEPPQVSAAAGPSPSNTQAVVAARGCPNSRRSAQGPTLFRRIGSRGPGYHPSAASEWPQPARLLPMLPSGREFGLNPMQRGMIQGQPRRLRPSAHHGAAWPRPKISSQGTKISPVQQSPCIPGETAASPRCRSLWEPRLGVGRDTLRERCGQQKATGQGTKENKKAPEEQNPSATQPPGQGGHPGARKNTPARSMRRHGE